MPGFRGIIIYTDKKEDRGGRMAREKVIQDPERLLRNMVRIRDILAAHGIVCFLHYGTCLGAVREKGFIPHDDDADLGIYAGDLAKLRKIIPEIEAAGFSQIEDREWGGRLIQFRDTGEGYAEQVDIFWEKQTRRFGIRKWDLGGRVLCPYRFLQPPLPVIDFLGEPFHVPNDTENFLRFLYGKDWRTPRPGAQSRYGILFQLNKLRKNPGKLFFYLRRFFRNHILRR